MNDEQSPFDELMRSPFDPASGESRPSRRRVPWELVAGIAVGAVAMIGGYVVASDDAPTQAITTTTTIATTTSSLATTAPVDTPVVFPPGFVEVTDMIGIKPEYMIDTGDELVIAFTTATRRGFEATEGFDGGDWVLETASGEELHASGITSSVAVAGSFSVQFAKEGEVTPERIRLTSRWELDYRGGSAEIPFTGIPFEAAEVAVDLGAGVSLVLERLSLGQTDGEVAWSLDGAGDRGAVINVYLLVGGGQSPSAVYSGSGDRSFGGGGFFDPFIAFDPSDLATEGVLTLTWSDAGGSSQDPLSIEVSATVVGTIAADLAFDLQGLPGLER